MKNERFHALLTEIGDLHDRKNHDYATDHDPLSNFRMCEAFGISAFKGILVRLSDKWSRICQLASGKSPKNESFRDTLIDTAVYSLLAVLVLDEDIRRFDAAILDPDAPLCASAPYSPSPHSALPEWLRPPLT